MDQEVQAKDQEIQAEETKGSSSMVDALNGEGFIRHVFPIRS
jgi:hypothetical protein